MKKYFLVQIIFMFVCVTAYGDYAFEVISEKHDEDTVEAKQINETTVNMENVVIRFNF